MKVIASMRKAVFVVLIGFGLLFTAKAQLTVRQDRLPEEMVKDVLIGRGVIVKNVRFSGIPASLGEFSYPDATNFFTSGIILSSGKASDMAAPNDNPKTSTVTGGPGDKNLYVLAGTRTFDACALDFDFMADRDSVSFNFIFASEEYNDYVGSTFNDAFALVISSTNMPAKNFAVLPGTNAPISVNSVNAGQNRQYYQDNNPYTLVGKINESVKASLNQNLLQNLSFDGMTKVMSVGCRVVPKQVYHFQVSIADAGDGTVDSAILLGGKSLNSQEQYKHVLRRAQIAEQHRQDSLARAKVIEDSLRVAAEINMLRDKVRQDSIANAKRHYDDSLRLLGTQPLPVDTVRPIQHDANWESPNLQPSGTADTENPAPPKSPKADVQELVTYEGESYLLSPDQESKIKEFGRLLSQNRKLKIGIYLPEGDPSDVITMRYDLIRLELIKAGASAQQIFRNGFSHSSSGSIHRAEIWMREE